MAGEQPQGQELHTRRTIRQEDIMGHADFRVSLLLLLIESQGYRGRPWLS
jgi:hypothetical protein